jgi:hypothetical protein
VGKHLPATTAGGLSIMLPKNIKAKDILPNDLVICINSVINYNVKCVGGSAEIEECWTNYRLSLGASRQGNQAANITAENFTADQSNPDRLSFEDAACLAELVRKKTGYRYEVREIDRVALNTMMVLSIREVEEDEDVIVVIASKDNDIHYIKYSLSSEQNVFLIERGSEK